MNVFEEVAKELDKGAPWILYRQDLAAILRRMAAAHGEDERVRKDAARYRTVREHAARAPGAYQSWKHLDAEQFDAAIDAAMRE